MISEVELERLMAEVSNWGRWGPDDEKGTVNFITPEKRLRAAAAIRSGKTFSLSLPFHGYGPQPPEDRRLNPQHIMLESGTDLLAGVQPGQKKGYGYADDMVIMALQCATHWDGLSHVFYDYKMYNDRSCALVNATGAQKNSITAVADAIVTRAVLLDFPRALGLPWLPPDHRITVAEIEATIGREGVRIEPGDILCFRTGHMYHAHEAGGWDHYTYTNEPGPGVEVLPWLHAHDIAGVASDTWGFEVVPSGSPLWLPFHAVGIVAMGLLIGENFFLDEWARDSAEDGIYEAFLAATPIPFSRAVGAPVHPVVIK